MGSDTEGLICAFLLDGRGGGERLDWQGVTRHAPGARVVWVHLDYTARRSSDWLFDEAGLDPVVAEALLSEESRPRCSTVSDGLLLSLRGVNLNPGADPEDMIAIRIWASRGVVVTTRRRRTQAATAIAELIKAGQGPLDAGDLLVHLGQQLMGGVNEVLDAIGERADTLEEEILADGSQALRPQLLELRREAIMLRRYLAPQREALARLQAEKVPWLEETDRLRMRELADQAMRQVEDLDAVRDRGGVAYEELSSRLAEQMNARMYLLSLIAGLFLPLGFLTGLLGINVGGIPGTDDPWAFTWVVAMLLLIGVLQYLFFRKRHWI